MSVIYLFLGFVLAVDQLYMLAAVCFVCSTAIEICDKLVKAGEQHETD